MQRVLGCMAAASTATTAAGAIFGIGKGCGYGSVFHDSAACIGSRCGVTILIRFCFGHRVSDPGRQVLGGLALSMLQGKRRLAVGKGHIAKHTVDAGILERHGEVECLRRVSGISGYGLGNGQIAVSIRYIGHPIRLSCRLALSNDQTLRHFPARDENTVCIRLCCRSLTARVRRITNKLRTDFGILYRAILAVDLNRFRGACARVWGDYIDITAFLGNRVARCQIDIVIRANLSIIPKIEGGSYKNTVT